MVRGSTAPMQAQAQAQAARYRGAKAT